MSLHIYEVSQKSNMLENNFAHMQSVLKYHAMSHILSSNTTMDIITFDDLVRKVTSD